MSDFRKGLIVGMLIIFGCAAFMANKDDSSSKRRYEYFLGSYMIDTWSGKIFEIPSSKLADEYKKQNLPPFFLNVVGVVHPSDTNLKEEVKIGKAPSLETKISNQ